MGKRGETFVRCKLQENPQRRGLELPVWMLDSARCAQLTFQQTPRVSCQALGELRRLLDVLSANKGIQQRYLSHCTLRDFLILEG
jgi:hypothetical protein